MKGIEQWECQNFIEVLQTNPAENNTLFVCGTNAQTPKCRYFSVSSVLWIFKSCLKIEPLNNESGPFYGFLELLGKNKEPSLWNLLTGNKFMPNTALKNGRILSQSKTPGDNIFYNCLRNMVAQKGVMLLPLGRTYLLSIPNHQFRKCLTERQAGDDRERESAAWIWSSKTPLLHDASYPLYQAFPVIWCNLLNVRGLWKRKRSFQNKFGNVAWAILVEFRCRSSILKANIKGALVSR